MTDRKIIFFDIDGTIYDYRTGVEPSTREAIARLVENGHIPVLCTGRARAMILEELIDLGFQGIVGACGTYVEYAGVPIKNVTFSPNEVKRILEASRKYEQQIILEGSSALYYVPGLKNPEYAERINHMVEKYPFVVPVPDEEDGIGINKMTVHFGRKEELAGFREELKDILEAILHIEPGDDNYAEFVPVGYTKATGIEALLDYLQIDQKDSYAFGDSVNDLEMLRYVNYGIAMGNSSEEVLEAARYRTTGIYEDGIYRGLKNFSLI